MTFCTYHIPMQKNKKTFQKLFFFWLPDTSFSNTNSNREIFPAHCPFWKGIYSKMKQFSTKGSNVDFFFFFFFFWGGGGGGGCGGVFVVVAVFNFRVDSSSQGQ